MSSGKHKTPYPVARPFTPPAEYELPKSRWPGLAALAALVAFLCAGLIMLINCLQPEPDPPKGELPPESAQAVQHYRDLIHGERGSGLNFSPPVVPITEAKDGKPTMPGAPSQQTPPSQEQEASQKDSAQGVIGHDLGAPLKDPRPRNPNGNPLLKLDQPKQAPATP